MCLNIKNRLVLNIQSKLIFQTFFLYNVEKNNYYIFNSLLRKMMGPSNLTNIQLFDFYILETMAKYLLLT